MTRWAFTSASVGDGSTWERTDRFDAPTSEPEF